MMSGFIVGLISNSPVFREKEANRVKETVW